MPYSFEIDHRKKLIIRIVWDRYDDEQASLWVTDFSQIDVHESYDELHDLSGVTEYLVTPSKLSSQAFESANQETESFQSKRVAIVAPSDLVYGMSRIYSGYHGDSKEDIRSFRSKEAAMNWLFDEKHDLPE